MLCNFLVGMFSDDNIKRGFSFVKKFWVENNKWVYNLSYYYFYNKRGI